MKRLTLTAILLATLAVAASAQGPGAVDPAVQKQIGTALTAYYGLKDALIESNVETASSHAGDLVKALDAVEVPRMTAAQKADWEKLGTRIRTDASHIAKNKDLEHQREHFAKLSNNMYSLVFGFKANETETYLHYCPMKKASWLSTSKDVKNPYYGGKMLTCGAVKATLKKGSS